MQTSKRLLALLLCAVMLFTTVPVEAFATGEVPSDETVVTEPVVEETESTGVPSETEAEAETSAPEEVTEEPTVSPEEDVTEEVTEPEEEAGINALAEGDVVSVTDGEGNVTGYASLQAAFDGFAPSNNTYGGTYVVKLLGDTAGPVNKNLQYPTELLDITLDLNGHTITGTGSSAVVVINFGSGASVGSTFTITDSVGGGTITGGKGGVIFSGKGCTLNFQGGTITGNHGASKGGGINVGATAFFNMTGGTITGNSVTGSSSANSGYGGGVLVNYGSITGGAIYGNTANAGSHVQTGRGGGVCTEITRTSGYSTLTIANGVVFGNTAGNAGDDLMIQGNGLSGTKYTLSIGTEGWYVDGWNGKKATTGNGEAARYSAENPVAYTDGGFTNTYNISIGLKYVAPSTEPEEPKVPAAPYDNGGSDTNVADYIQFVDANGHGALMMNITGGFTAGEVVWNEELGTWTCDLTFDAAALLAAYNESYAGHRYVDEIGETITVTHKWFCGEGAELSTTEGKWVPNVDGNIYKVNVTCKALYTVTYTDGVEDEEIFADQTYTVEEGEATPAFNGNPYREGYTFEGWTPDVTETVTGNVTYSAQWAKIPVYVARLESTQELFETLQATINAAQALMVDANGAEQTVTLLADVTESCAISWTGKSTSPAKVILNIDLNGHTVTGNGGSVFTVRRSGSYTAQLHVVFKDSVGTGVVTGGTGTVNGANTYGGAIYAIGGSSYVTIEGGTWTGNTATHGGVYAGAYTNNTNYITINGGTLTGNTATGNGGAIYGRYAFINGGTITGNTAASGGGVYVFIAAATKIEMTGGAIYGNTATTDGDDIVWRANRGTSSTAYLKLIAASSMGNGLTGWYMDGADARFSADNAVEFTSYAKYSTLNTRVSLKAAQVLEKFTVTYTDGVEGVEIFADQSYTVEEGTATPAFVSEADPVREGYTFGGWNPAVAETVTGDVTYTAIWVPNAPTKFGENVTTSLVRVICDTDPDHAPMDIKWMHQSTKVRTWESGVVWSEEHNAWIVPIRIDSISVYYVWLNFEKEYNDIIHELVPDAPVPAGDNYIDTYLKWDAAKELWVTLDGNPIEIHTTCKTAPTAPTTFQLKSYQIKVTGIVDGEEKVYYVYVDPNAMTIGEVKGSREEGFTVDVTVAITEDDAHQAGWIEKRDPTATVADHEYDWSRTPATITITVKYTGDLAGNLYGNRTGDWVWVDNNKTYGTIGEAYMVTAKPAAPEQKNVVEDLVTIICDSDPERHAPVTGKWYPQHCSTTSDIVWNEELKAWTVDIRIGSLYIMYVDQLEDANNGTEHTLVEDITTVYSTLIWDAEQGLWVPAEPIELHTTCRTAPIAPSYDQIDGYQIKVYGDVDDDGVYGETKASNKGIGEVWTTSIPEGGYVLSEVYGSREEGFFVDVTVTIENGDAYITNWIANCEPGAEYLYDFEKTPTTVTFTLRYNGSLNGTLHGDRHASNTNYDWVLDTTDLHYGVVGEGYVEQKTYAVQLVIYRNGNTTAPYDVIALDRMPKGTVIDLSTLDINDYYSSRLGFEFEGWFNDGAWNQYKAGKEVAGLEEITVNGWTNIICMVTDYQTVQIQIYRNGNTTDVYKTVTLDKMLKGDVLDLTTLDINDYYSSTYGFVFEGWFNDGKWNQYKAGQDVTGMTEITINGWTNIICMVTDNQKVVVKAVVNGDKDNAEVIFNGAAPKGVNLIEWLNENVEVPEKEGYTADMWYNWDWYGHKFGENAKVNGWTNVYVTYTANEYTVSYNTNGGPEVADKVVTFGGKYGIMPTSTITGLSCRKTDWYLVDENGNVTDINIRNTSVVSVARDHELFLMRDVLAPTLKITLEVPGAISDDYKYYVPGNSTRILTVTVNNMNEEVLDYTYQWYKDGVLIEGATEAVLTLDGNVSDSGTYKVVVTATLKDGSEIVVKVDTASAEKSQKVQIMRAANTLRLNENYGETPVTSDSYWGSAVATIRGGATREGYTFAGWNTAADGSGETYQVGDEIEFAGDNGNGGVVLELFAQWIPMELKVYYYIDGELVNEFVLTGEAITAVNVYDYMPEKAGYTLTCWYEKAADIGNPAKAEPNAEQNLTNKKVIRLYGSYEPITYRIKYAGGEGAEYVGDLPNSKNDWVIIAGYPYGEEITLHDGTGFQRTGYTLVGWTIKGKTYELGGTAEGSFTTVQSGMITAYAVWEGNSYTLILDANGGEFVMPLAEDSDAVTTVEIPVTYGEVIGELPTPVREGYTFAGWFDAEGNEITADTVYNTDGDLTVTAKWTPNTYEVKLDANGGELEDDTIEATYGEPIGELPTPTRDGYTFAGWVDADGNKVTADTIYDVADDITLVATWNVNKPADPSSPATGDGMTMFFMVSMLASAAALLFLADRKRRMAA